MYCTYVLAVCLHLQVDGVDHVLLAAGVRGAQREADLQVHKVHYIGALHSALPSALHGCLLLTA